MKTPKVFPMNCLFCSHKIRSRTALLKHMNGHHEINDKDKSDYLDDILKILKKIEVKSKPKKVEPKNIEPKNIEPKKARRAIRKFNEVRLSDETFDKFKELHLERVTKAGYPASYIRSVRFAKNANELEQLIRENSGIGIPESTNRKGRGLIYTPVGGQDKYRKR